MKANPTIAIVPLGHYIYFQQFDGLKAELEKKAEELASYFDNTSDISSTMVMGCCASVSLLKISMRWTIFSLCSAFATSNTNFLHHWGTIM